MGINADSQLLQDFLHKCSLETDLSLHSLSSSSSRLLTGNSQAYLILEQTLREWYGRPSALVFNSGYHANLGILAALSEQGYTIFSDRLNHASLIDGMRLNNRPYHRYRHLDYGHLENLLMQHRDDRGQAVIVTESIFSMDGDIADLKRLISLKQKYDCILYVDEAHAVGARGETGLGICEEQSCIEDIDIIVGTFGKAMSSIGAYAVCTPVIRDFLVNTARSLIFSTALPPLNVLWTVEVIQAIRVMQEARQRLYTLSQRLRQTLQEAGFQSGGDSHIVPLMLGANEIAVEKAKRLQEEGFLVFPIRPPTVAPGTARLRFSLSSVMDWQDLAGIPSLLKIPTK